jgi:hypothetical protein
MVDIMELREREMMETLEVRQPIDEDLGRSAQIERVTLQRT